MHIAVIIPYRRRGDPSLLQWTLEGYARQRLGARQTMELRIGIDDGLDQVIEPWERSELPFPTTIVRQGPTGARGVRVSWQERQRRIC